MVRESDPVTPASTNSAFSVFDWAGTPKRTVSEHDTHSLEVHTN
jgi:hypothetical protein